jgi:DNA-binding response OmpR family regulator
MDKIVLIDSDTVFCEALERKLVRAGYATLVAHNGVQGLELARSSRPDLVILEAQLPELDGFAVCRMLRFESDVSILILSACQDEADRVLGLDLGADDYVIKPFLEGELQARIRALLRRSARPVRRTTTAQLSIGNLYVDLDARRVFRGDDELHLAQKEFDLLVFLIDHAGQTISRELMLEYVWGEEFRSDIRTVDVHIRWLRSKIEPDPSSPQYIHTVRKLGYRFSVDA